MKHCEAEGNCGQALSTREYWIAGASIAAGAALGLTLMYLYDPDRGKRRRTELREQAESKLRHVGKDLAGKAEDVFHRAKGAVREATSGLGHCSDEEASDAVIHDRVRSRLGHLVPDAGEVETEVKQGIVALRGKVPPADRKSLFKSLRAIPGVRGVEDLLAAESFVG